MGTGAEMTRGRDEMTQRSTDNERRYTWYEVAHLGAIPAGTHVIFHTPANPGGGGMHGPGLARMSGTLGFAPDQVSSNHVTLNGRRLLAGVVADDYFSVSDERVNEVEPSATHAPIG